MIEVGSFVFVYDPRRMGKVVGITEEQSTKYDGTLVFNADGSPRMRKHYIIRWLNGTTTQTVWAQLVETKVEQLLNRAEKLTQRLEYCMNKLEAA